MAVTEDRIDVYTNVLDRRVMQDLPLASGEVLYAKTLAQINSNGELEAVSHTSAADDSLTRIRAVLEHMEEGEGVISNLESRYPSGNRTDAQCWSGVLLEFDVNEADTTGYSLDDTAYAVDNSTVANAEADGGAGKYAPVGPVYSINPSDNTVVVLVEGIDA